MAKIRPGVNEYSNKIFTHDQGKKSLVTEASMLCGVGRSMFSQLYDDAMDAGLALRNPKTGTVTYWTLDDVIYDIEGDVSCWELKPVESQLATTPALAGYSMTIFND